MSEVLALKYRPQKFEEIIGQDQTVNQLCAAIEGGTLGHALLFCGTRGTGKTTTARVVARELNRDYLHEVCIKLAVLEDIIEDPKRLFESRPELADELLPELESKMLEHWVRVQPLLVTEVDAASNTGVDNVRELIEKVRYASDGHRVIILDEAHMLSKSACNALLKTLEEPPRQVTFILSTTEPHKLIPTIRSRCQIYEFHDVDRGILEDYYREIMKKEGKDIDVTAAALKAEGSVRDGLSILQKALSGKAEADNSKQYFELVGSIYSGDVSTALALVAEIRKAEDARIVIQTLEKWFWWCSLESFGMRTPIREYFESETALQFDLSHLQKLFQTCLEVERNFTATPNSKIVLEMGVMRLCL